MFNAGAVFFFFIFFIFFFFFLKRMRETGPKLINTPRAAGIVDEAGRGLRREIWPPPPPPPLGVKATPPPTLEGAGLDALFGGRSHRLQAIRI